MSKESKSNYESFTPARPNLIAFGLTSVWVLILSIPMLSGRFLAGPYSDQQATGFAFREWGAAMWRELGSIPQWNPTIFGGMPFIAAMHGDIFYPTAWLRLVLPTGTAMNLGFLVHYLIAGFFMYVLLRKLSVTWAGAVVGGLTYELSGVVATYVQPGHDGKLFVTALLPIAFIALVMALREKRMEGHGLLALTVGLAVLSPHYQMVYYMLVASAAFALYLTFGSTGDSVGDNVKALSLALGAVVLGFGVAMIQVLPFFTYLPFSPRAEGYGGFEASASYAIPWNHVPEFFLSSFVGTTPDGSYWGGNPLKLHSEYMGLAAVALAILGGVSKRRRAIVIWLGACGLLLLLVALGSATPFYRLWWEIMPFVKQTRAPGMALFVPVFVVAMFAAFGVERLEREGNGGKTHFIWLGTGAVVAFLALVGAFSGAAQALASDPNRAAAAGGAAGLIRTGALLSGLALLALGGVVWLFRNGKLDIRMGLLLIAGIVGADLWLNARPFWVYSNADRELFSEDEITALVRSNAVPERVLDLGTFLGRPTYPGSALMGLQVSQLLGHHGNELDWFDKLLGGRNTWLNLRSPQGIQRFLDLYAIKYVLVPTGTADLDAILPNYRPVLEDVTASSGMSASVLERIPPTRYVRFVPGAVQLPDEQAIHSATLPNFPTSNLIVLGLDAPFDVPDLERIPDAVDVAVTVDTWRPGYIELTVRAAPDSGYVLVAENYYPDWKTEVNGVPAPTLRANNALLAVPVGPGDSRVAIRFDSDDYARGKLITLLSLLVVAGLIFAPPLGRRRRGDG